MTDVAHHRQELKPREIGSFNTIGVIALFRMEVDRFLRVPMDSFLGPLASVLLIYMIFALAFGGDDRVINGVPYLHFLVPGLLIMVMAQGAFNNTSTSLTAAKMRGNIVDILMPPLSPFEILLAFVAAGVLRGLMAGAFCFAVMIPFISFSAFHPLHALFFGVMGAMMMALLGMIISLRTGRFEWSVALTSFVIMPLMLLSGIFYSIRILPPLWQEIVHMNPFFFMVDGFRYGIIGYADANLLNGASLLIVINFGLLIYCYALLLVGYRGKV